MAKTGKIRIPDLLEMKRGGKKIAMMTAYDASMAAILDDAGMDVLLVGDSLGMVVRGDPTSLGVTLDMVVHHCRAVSNGVSKAVVVGDMPFLTYATPDEAIHNAGRLIQQGGAEAVKLEGGESCAPVVRTLTNAGIPVMGHVGLLPQHVHKRGGFRAAGKTPDEAGQLLADAHALEAAGAFALVIECVPVDLARQISAAIAIPTIGIGAGPFCDGQVLVSYDAFGLYRGMSPRFVKRYADLGTAMADAARSYIDEVRNGAFPDLEHSIGK